MADNKNMMSVNGKESDSDDDELAALREAALRSKRMRPEERKPVETVVQLPPVLHPVAPLVVACPFDRRQLPRQPFGGRGQMRLPRVGSQNFIRPNARSNLIVIQTVPLEEDKPVASQPPPPPTTKLDFHASSQEKSMIVRPQDRWAPSNDVKLHASSPAKPKASVMDMLWNDPQLMIDGSMPTKFDRYDSSGSESEEDLSSHDDSDSEDDSINISREMIQEPQPTSEQLQSDSAFTETNADLPASDASSPNSLTNSSKLLLDSPTNSPASEQVPENQSSKRSSTKSFVSAENSPSNLHSLVPESKSLSPASSKSICSQSEKEILQIDTLRTDSKSPVNLKSQSDDVKSSSSSRSSSSVSSRLLDSPAPSSVSPASASPAPPRSRSKSPMDMLLADSVNCPSSLRSPVRARSPARLRSPVHVRSKAHSKSPVNLSSPMRLRSKTRSRSRSRSPLSMRSLSSRSKTSSRSPAHLGLKSHSRSPQKFSSHVRARSRTRSRSPMNSKLRLYSGLRGSPRSPGNISSHVVRPRSRTRSRSPAIRRLETVPFRSRTHSRSPPKLLSSRLNRSPSDSRSPRFNKSPVYRKSPVHSRSPVFSRSRELLRSPPRGRLPLVSKGSPGQLKQKAVSGFALQARSSEHILSPAHMRPLRISRSPEHISSGVHSTSPKLSRSPVRYRAPAHSRSPRNSGSPRNLRFPRHSRSPERSRYAETTMPSRRYRSLERSLSPRQARSRSHSRSPRIRRSPVDFSELSLSYSRSGVKSRLLGSGSPTFSRSSSPGNGSYRLSSRMTKHQNGGFAVSGLRLQPERHGPREEAHLQRHGSMRLEGDRMTSKSTTHHHSSHYSAGAGNRPEVETRKPDGRLNNMANAHYWIDNEKDGKMKRISPDIKQRGSVHMKDQHDWRDELMRHDSGCVKDQRGLRDTEIDNRTDLKQHHSDYDQVLEMRKRKFHNVGLASAEGKGQTLFLHSRRLKSRSDDSVGRGKTDGNVLRGGDGDNYNKYDDRNEYRMRNRIDRKSDRIESRLDQKLDDLRCRGHVEPKKSERKTTDVSEKRLTVRSRSGSQGFSSQKSSTAFDKAAEKSLGADECDSETQSSESVSSDADARLSQSRPSLSDDSDSETEASGPREKRFTERNDLPATNPVSKLACDDKFRRKGFQAGSMRYTRKHHDIVSREDIGMKQNYIPPLMEGLRFGKLRSRSPSPHRLQRSPSRSPAAKRTRNDNPPSIRSVLSVVKLAKSASSTDLRTETKQSDAPGEKALLQTVKRSSDEEKSSVAEVENSDGLSDVQKEAEPVAKKMDDKCDAGSTPSSDQRTIQITFNQKMEFDESVKLSSRRSVHQRLGKIESGARKDKSVESTARQVVAEEKKFVDLRDLIGEKSRQIVYKVDSPAVEETEEMEDDEEAGAGDELFQRRKKSRPPRRRRKFNDNPGTGKLEGRHAGRPNYS